MTSTLLWRRLSPTDFAAMNGNASPHGRGGGAKHIALGVRSAKFPIDRFLNASGKAEATVSAAADPYERTVAELTFSGNPNRRGGEWRINDQHSHRHPAWSPAAAFPAKYRESNPPYVLIFKVGRLFHARFCLEAQLRKLGTESIPENILVQTTGIAVTPPTLAKLLHVPGLSRFDEFEAQRDITAEYPFDPKNIIDGRKRIIRSVIQRLGQQTFRRNLFSAYGGQCAMTKCRTEWVLEAAHIVPYRGTKTNAVNNGLLLRADIHTLFDLSLIAIEPRKIVMKVSSLLEGSMYEALNDKSPRFPTKSKLHPSKDALEYHFGFFRP